MNRRFEVVRLLADGAAHSGEALARDLDVSRAAVWKQVQQLGEWGISVRAKPRHGYRLDAPIELLDAGAIRGLLGPSAAARLQSLDVLPETTSTNTVLLERPPVPAGRYDACLAEFQSAGRGRRGRRWLAPFGSGVCLSVAWTFADAPAELPALSLAVGVAALRTLGDCGIAGARLKWPNDLVFEGGKLGGILIELRAEAGGPAQVVVGLGLNLRLPAAVRDEVRAEGVTVADLAGLPGGPPSRNRLAAALLTRLVLVLEEFEQQGFAPFLDEWRAADALRAKPARVQNGRTIVEGVARGIDTDGALLLEVEGRLARFVSGDASVRPVA